MLNRRPILHLCLWLPAVAELLVRADLTGRWTRWIGSWSAASTDLRTKEPWSRNNDNSGQSKREEKPFVHLRSEHGHGTGS